MPASGRTRPARPRSHAARDPARGHRPRACRRRVVCRGGRTYTLVEPQLDEAGTGDWQPQQASGCAVRSTPIPDALVELHSHHAMRAYFSATDDRDETARRVYGVIGRLDSQQPEIALRVATGCKPHAVEPVPFAQVFAADLGDFRDVHFFNDRTDTTDSESKPRPPSVRARHYGRPSLLVSFLLDMAEDVALIRQGLEARQRSDWENSALWTPR